MSLPLRLWNYFAKFTPTLSRISLLKIREMFDWAKGNSWAARSPLMIKPRCIDIQNFCLLYLQVTPSCILLPFYVSPVFSQVLWFRCYSLPICRMNVIVWFSFRPVLWSRKLLSCGHISSQVGKGAPSLWKGRPIGLCQLSFCIDIQLKIVSIQLSVPRGCGLTRRWSSWVEPRSFHDTVCWWSIKKDGAS